MRKIISIALVLILFLNFNAYALDTLLLEMRDKIFEESKQIKLLMSDSRDIIALDGMWDACIVTITQLGAYFFMLGIFNTIEEKELTGEAIDYLERWLNETKRTNNSNIKNVESLSQSVDARTVIHIERLKILYADLNNVIEAELKKIFLVRESLKMR